MDEPWQNLIRLLGHLSREVLIILLAASAGVWLFIASPQSSPWHLVQGRQRSADYKPALKNENSWSLSLGIFF
jgi:hypothetical protein